MTKRLFTPGPWHDWTTPDGAKWVTHGDDSRTICRVTTKDGLGSAGQHPRDVKGCANARLIAAAPEMLDELRHSQAWLAKVAADHDGDDTGLSERAMRQHARNAAVIELATKRTANAEAQWLMLDFVSRTMPTGDDDYNAAWKWSDDELD